MNTSHIPAPSQQPEFTNRLGSSSGYTKTKAAEARARPMLLEIIGQFECGGSGAHFGESSRKFKISRNSFGGIAVAIRPDTPIESGEDLEEFLYHIDCRSVKALQKIIQAELNGSKCDQIAAKAKQAGTAPC